MRKGAAVAALAAGLVLAGGGMAVADSGATGAAFGSPGVLSGNVLEVPLDLPLNLCGDSLDLLALLNPSPGTTCADISTH
ncbi:chaplin [Actinacidiphila acididurans]|uniref:Chaplin n=1 Tax=Actinacidiphila acididurans TaxID=2784346 RepID=A0ABS2TJ50_9ACTN|nr:chaplin [Actinacidiphila acididurans]MBM9503376.1 chaplin [Actinacidiphila acididurans]